MVKPNLPPGTITFGEALERLKKNPNDPDPKLQHLRKTLDRIAKNLAPTREQMQAQLDNMVKTIQSVMPQAVASLQNLRGFVQTDYFKRTLKNLADPPTPIDRQLKYLSPLEDSQNIRLARIENYAVVQSRLKIRHKLFVQIVKISLLQQAKAEHIVLNVTLLLLIW